MNTATENDMTEKIICTWTDHDSPETVKLAAQAYGLTVKKINTDVYTEVTLAGPTENVKRFEHDYFDNKLEPFESKKDLPPDEYQEWLADQLAELGVRYIPKTTIEN